MGNDNRLTCLPLNRGTAFQTEIGPREENCPIAISRKNSGRPAVTNMMTYGIRKLAEMLHKSDVQKLSKMLYQLRLHFVINYCITPM